MADLAARGAFGPSLGTTYDYQRRQHSRAAGATREFQLCYPKDMTGSPDQLSVLAPVGAALLGLSAGQVIDWPLPDGGHTRLTVLDVVWQPEAAGELHR